MPADEREGGVCKQRMKERECELLHNCEQSSRGVQVCCRRKRDFVEARSRSVIFCLSAVKVPHQKFTRSNSIKGKLHVDGNGIFGVRARSGLLDARNATPHLTPHLTDSHEPADATECITLKGTLPGYLQKRHVSVKQHFALPHTMSAHQSERCSSSLYSLARSHC